MKAYYQWVPFMLFLQSIMFYLPHIIYKGVEGGKIKVRREIITEAAWRGGGSRLRCARNQYLRLANSRREFTLKVRKLDR